MSKEHLEQFMKQVADSKELQAKIGEATTEDALVALGAAHGRESAIEEVQAGAGVSEAELEGVAGGAFADASVYPLRASSGLAMRGGRFSLLTKPGQGTGFKAGASLGKRVN